MIISTSISPVNPNPLSIITPSKIGEIALDATVTGCVAALISPSHFVPYFSASNALVLLVIMPDARPKNEKNKMSAKLPWPSQRHINPISNAKCPIKLDFRADTQSNKKPDKNAPMIAVHA